MDSSDLFFYVNIVMSVIGLIGSGLISRFFYLNSENQLFRAFFIYFFIVNLGFLFGIYKDIMLYLMEDTAVFKHVVSLTIFRSMFVIGVIQLLYNLYGRNK